MEDTIYGTLTSKGQITIPKAVREALALKTGDQVAFERRADGSIVLVARNADIRGLKGIVRHAGRPVSLAAMDAAVANGVARRAR